MDIVMIYILAIYAAAITALISYLIVKRSI